MKKLIALILSLCLFTSFGISCFANSSGIVTPPTPTSEGEIPINNFYDMITDTEFVNNGVIYITMHHYISDVGKVYTTDDFPELDIEKIEDYTSANLNDKKGDLL